MVLPPTARASLSCSKTGIFGCSRRTWFQVSLKTKMPSAPGGGSESEVVRMAECVGNLSHYIWSLTIFANLVGCACLMPFAQVIHGTQLPHPEYILGSHQLILLFEVFPRGGSSSLSTFSHGHLNSVAYSAPAKALRVCRRTEQPTTCVWHSLGGNLFGTGTLPESVRSLGGSRRS